MYVDKKKLEEQFSKETSWGTIKHTKELQSGYIHAETEILGKHNKNQIKVDIFSNFWNEQTITTVHNNP